MPDGQGGVLASWSRDSGTSPPNVELKVTRVSGGSAAERSLSGSIRLIGENGTAYVMDNGTLVAMDAVAWAPRWTVSTNAEPIAAVQPTRHCLGAHGRQG
jgi:hypothetical protein